MKFGVFFTVRWHEEWTQERSLLEVLERAELADQAGFDEIWLGEHHFSRHGILSGLFSFTGHVAARTKRTRESASPSSCCPSAIRYRWPRSLPR